MKLQNYTLGGQDVKKILKGALIAIGGALLTYFSGVVTHSNWGSYTTLVMAFWSVVVNLLTKILDGQVN